VIREHGGRSTAIRIAANLGELFPWDRRFVTGRVEMYGKLVRGNARVYEGINKGNNAHSLACSQLTGVVSIDHD
jgi:hypothetical protein